MKKQEIKREQLYQGVVNLTYPTQRDLCSAFLRPVEFEASAEPQFNHKVFTLDKFKEWYLANHPDGIKTGRFNYDELWATCCFSLDNRTFSKFLKGDFNPLSRSEKTLLSLLPSDQEKYEKKYVITGTLNGADPLDTVHEVGHAFWYLSPEYAQQQLEVVKNMNKGDVRVMHKLLTEEQYDSADFDDEIHAYMLASLKCMQEERGINITKSMRQASRKTNDIFDKFKEKMRK